MNFNRRKPYTRPVFHALEIDREISLIMMTWTNETTPPPPGGPGSPPAAPSQFDNSDFKENPFVEK